MNTITQIKDEQTLLDEISKILNACQCNEATVSQSEVSQKQESEDLILAVAGAQPQHWKQHEQLKFIEAIEKYGRDKPTKISEFVQTKSIRQVISHTQKYVKKMERAFNREFKDNITKPSNFGQQQLIEAKHVKQFVQKHFQMNGSFDKIQVQTGTNLIYDGVLYIDKNTVVTQVQNAYKICQAFNNVYNASDSVKITLTYLEEKMQIPAGLIALIVKVM
ncbi:Myb-like_DNA-binding domain-containing protein [Hexamita inflata]|uniref:Myb-like DNA-binding domain-containing protein n=1 Tax=Hexamita inflata TaxID=28002 RepID=A0AA86QI03_9EUKA|nr:Myb-like DNA-binding domain-containing protein [Hexamita inflata]